MQNHDLKTWPKFFQPILDGTKTFEIRVNDRGFKVGCLLHLREWEPETKQYTGRAVVRRVTYITEHAQRLGYVVMSIAPESP